MASCARNTDIWTCIQNLPHISEWKTNSISITICSSNSSKTNLNLTITKNPPTQLVTLSIFASLSLQICLWTSKPLPLVLNKLLDDETTTYNLISNLIQEVLKYGPSKQSYPLKLPIINPKSLVKDFFNFSFLTLAFLVCIYEAPVDIRANCLVTLKDQLMSLQCREASKLLMKYLGTNIEEQWMRCLSLAVTNWKNELRTANYVLKGRCPLFAYSFSTTGLWKVHVYCPVITMEIENSSGSVDERLGFSLNYHQLEGVIQLYPVVTLREKWIDVCVNVDNLRLDVVRLVSEALLNDRGAGSSEKHFPSRISLQLTPTSQTSSILGLTITKSSQNPQKEIESSQILEFSFEPPRAVGINLTAGETTTTTFKPWKFEQTAVANTVRLNWSLHDSNGGKEVFSSKPSPIKLIQPKAWFRHRYSNVHRPFTRQGGVVFARDEYGESVCWKVDKAAVGQRLEWEVEGVIGLTYWPNKYRGFYSETRRAEFKETLHLTLT